MNIENNLTLSSAIFLGIFIGFKHALEGDHVIAIATIKNDKNKILNTIMVGVSWGAGHSIPLLVLGSTVLLLKNRILDEINNLSSFFEFLVAIVLIFLGSQIIIKNIRNKNLLHSHNKDQISLHVSHNKNQRNKNDHEDNHYLMSFIPFFRPKSFLIGVIHGLAGTGALMVILLPNHSNFLNGIIFLIFFSIGTIISMSFVTVVLFAPLEKINSTKLLQIITTALGLASIILGTMLFSDLWLGSNFTSILWY